jgi:hypothetical protein
MRPISSALLALALMGCPSDPVMPDAGRSDAGADAPVVPFDAGPETEVAGGSVMGSWCGAVHVTANATVDAGQTLTICAGSVVRFDADVSLSVAGTLLSEGTAGSRVSLGSDGTWTGIVLTTTGTANMTFTDIRSATIGLNGRAGGSITFNDGTIVAAAASSPVLVVGNGATLDRSVLTGGDTINITGGVLRMTDSTIDQLHPVATPDCTDWRGGGMVLDHVRITGCHCPIHINSSDEVVTITNSILDGATNPIMIANSVATITHNNFSGTGTLVLDIGRGDGIEADVSDNYWDGGDPNIGTTRAGQFTGSDVFSTTPFSGVGPR